jgi:hypothetical protein
MNAFHRAVRFGPGSWSREVQVRTCGIATSVDQATIYGGPFAGRHDFRIGRPHSGCGTHSRRAAQVSMRCKPQEPRAIPAESELTDASRANGTRPALLAALLDAIPVGEILVA